MKIMLRARWFFSFTIGATFALPTTLFAQTSVPPATPRAAAAIACTDAAPEAVLDAARRRFEAGQLLLESHVFAEAEDELRAALAIYDSPNSHDLLARALRGQGRLAEAYNEFDATILLAARCSQADAARGVPNRYQRTVARSVLERDELTRQVALVTVRLAGDTPAGVEVSVAGRRVADATSGRTIACAAGQVEVTASAAGFVAMRESREVRAGETAEVIVRLVRAPTAPAVVVTGPRDDGAPRRSTRPWILRPVGLATSGAGVLGMIAGGAVFFVARGQYDDLRARCVPECPSDADYASRVNSGRTLETAGTVVFWAGVGVAAAGVGMYLLGGDRPSAQSHHASVVVPTADPSSRTLGLAGTF